MIDSMTQTFLPAAAGTLPAFPSDLFSIPSALGLLAQSEGVGGYMSFAKLGACAVVFFLWALCMQWVDRDTDVVKTKRERWNTVVLSGGLVGLAMFFLIPWPGPLFFLGLSFWIVLASSTLIAYIVHRNGRVVPNARVMTPGHFKRLLSGEGGKRKKAKSDAGQRVRIAQSDGKPIASPDDPEEAQWFDTTQDFLFDILWRRASDADVLIGKEKVRVLYRIDGVPTDASNGLSRDDAEKVLNFLKEASGQNVEEKRRPQKGELQVGLLTGPNLGTLEIQTSGSTEGERMRLRFRETAVLRRLPELGVAAPRLEQLQAKVAETAGMILFSGPKQSGVTTTQYASVKAHDAYTQNIFTIEVRPMLELENVTQNKHEQGNADVSYARQLQSVLRREPDIVLIGECPDRETAQLAVRAAAADKKVYIAVEATDCFDALERFRKLVDSPKELGKAMVAVVSQRLVRTLCSACKQAYKPDAELLKKANLPANKIEHFHRPPTEQLVDKKGNPIICQGCQGTGYVGRTGIFEVMILDDTIRSMLAQNAEIRQIKAQARKNKMYYLQEEGLFKVIEGVTSMAEVLRVMKEEAKA